MMKYGILSVIWPVVYSDPKETRIETRFGTKYDRIMRPIYDHGCHPVSDRINDRVTLVAVIRALNKVNQ